MLDIVVCDGNERFECFVRPPLNHLLEMCVKTDLGMASAETHNLGKRERQVCANDADDDGDNDDDDDADLKLTAAARDPSEALHVPT